MLARTLVALFVLVACFTAAAGAAAPLPASAIDDNTIVVVHIDLTRIDPAATRAAARNMLGSAAAAADIALALFQLGHESLTSSGLQSLTIAWSIPRAAGDSPYYAVFLQLKSGASESAIQKVVADQWPDKADAPAFDHVGGYLVAHLHDQPLHKTGSAARAKVFSEAFAEAGERAPLTIAFSPNPQIRKLANAVPTAGLSEQAAALVPLVLQSKWAVLAVNLNDAPGFLASVRAEDEAAAKQLIDAMRPPATPPSPPGAKAAPQAELSRDPVGTIAHLVHPVRTGSRVSFTLQGAALARFIALAIPAFGQAHEDAARQEASDHLRQLAAALVSFRQDHHGVLPDTLQQLRPYVGTEDKFNALLKNPRAGADPGFIYVKPATLRDPARTAVLFESRNGARDPKGAIGYADGHVQDPPLDPKPAK